MTRIGAAIGRFLGAVPSDEMVGERLQGPFWEVDHTGIDHAAFFRHIPDLGIAEPVLVLEGGAHPTSVGAFLETRSVPPRKGIARGTVWPRAKVFHLPCLADVLFELAALAENCASPEICDHLHIYTPDGVLAEWHGAFLEPLYLSKRLPEQRVQDFCRVLQLVFRDGNEGTA